MNIALIMERIDIWRGGAETSTIQVANELARLGCRVTILTTTTMPPTPTLSIVPIRANSAWHLSRTAAFARRAAAYVADHRFDIVHCITPCVAADVYQPRGGTVPEMLERNRAMRAGSLRRGFKHIGQRVRWKYRVLARLERRLLTRPSPPWVIAISQYVCDQIERHYHFDPERVRKIFNGVELDRTPPVQKDRSRREIRRQFDVAENDLLLLCVAHNFKLKGVARVIEALAHAPGQPEDGDAPPARGARMRVVIVGRDNPSPYLRLAQQCGAGDRVLFAGPTQRIQAFFHAADVLVHPTYYDPCSRVVLEAMASGLPVITTRFNGAAERITDGREGYVIDSPDDVTALADRIARLANDAHRHACAQSAPLAVRDATVANHAAQLLALYEEIVRCRSR